jgi:uncharacterized membrane protein
VSRVDFIRRLKKGLHQLPAETAAAMLADYESYFAEGARAGRAEEELTEALGNPSRLAAELRLDFDLRRWQTDQGVRSAARTISGVLRLGVFDFFLLLPLSLAVLGNVLGLVAALIVALAGSYMLVTEPFDAPVGGPVAAIVRGVSVISAGIAATAGSSLLALALAHALAWYARVHRRVLRPLFAPRADPSGDPT